MNRPYVPPEALAEESRLREKAEAQLTEAREVLRLVEWMPRGTDAAPRCPVCHAFEVKGHAPDCRLDKALRGVT